MNIVFMGTPDFAVPSLQALLNDGLTVSAVVTAPDKPRGRGQHVSFTPVKECALAHAIPVLQPESLRDPAFAEALRALDPDLFVIVAFRILPKDVFLIPKLGAFNLHASLLPKYRGAAPINWAIINGETESGVTTFFLQEKVDTGNVILRKRIAILPDMNAGELHDALMVLGASAVRETVERISQGRVELQAQDDALATPAPKIFREDCRIDWTKSAQAIHDFVRGLSPSPSAWTTHGGRMVKIYGTRMASDALPPAAAALGPGMVRGEHGRLFTGTTNGVLEILELQLEGKKRLHADEFLRGLREPIGSWNE